MSTFKLEATLTFARRGFPGFLSASVEATISGHFIHRDQLIATAGEALDVGDLAGTPGYYVVRNDDPDHDVDLFLDAGLSKMFATLRPGQFAAWAPPTSAAVYAKAYTAPCPCSMFACEALTSPALTARYVPVLGDAARAQYVISCETTHAAFSSQSLDQTADPTLAVQANAQLISQCLTTGYTEIMPLTSEYGWLCAFLNSSADTANVAIEGTGADKCAKLLGVPTLLPFGFGQSYYIGGAVGGEELLSLWGMTV